MGSYHVLMYITFEQEIAIRNLFYQNDWMCCCKALPAGLRDDLKLLLTHDLNGDDGHFCQYLTTKSVNEEVRNFDNQSSKVKKDPLVSEILDGYLNESCSHVSKIDNSGNQVSSVVSRTVSNDCYESDKVRNDVNKTKCEKEDAYIFDAVVHNHESKASRNVRNRTKVKPLMTGCKTGKVEISDSKLPKSRNETTGLGLQHKLDNSDDKTDHLRNRQRTKNVQLDKSSSDTHMLLTGTDSHTQQKCFRSDEKLSNTGCCVTEQDIDESLKHKNSNLSHRKGKHKRTKRTRTSDEVRKSKHTDADCQAGEHTGGGKKLANKETKRRKIGTKSNKSSTEDLSYTVQGKYVAETVVPKTELYVIDEKLQFNSCYTEKNKVDVLDEESNNSAQNKNLSKAEKLCKRKTNAKVKAETGVNSVNKENIDRNPGKQNKRVCEKCGKELIRKKICYDCELTCKYCGKSYANYKTRGRRCLLRTHLKSHEGDKPHICETCGKAFSHIDYMKRHAKLVHVDTEDPVLLCQTCGKSFKNNHTLQIHIKTIHCSEDETHQCDTCGTVFKRKGSLMAHLRRVHVETKNFKCDECGLMVKNTDSLRSHKRTAHAPRVRTVCYICGAMLLSHDKLKKHIMRHKNSRTFQCMKCSKKFYTSHEVRQHYRVHTGEKPFKCHLCTYACAVKGNLTKHMKKHKSGDSVPKHNYTGSSYSLDGQENSAEFVKLDNVNLDDDEQDNFDSCGQENEEVKVYQQL